MTDAEMDRLTLFGRSLRRSYIFGGLLITALSGMGSALGTRTSIAELRASDSLRANAFAMHQQWAVTQRDSLLRLIAEERIITRAVGIRMCLVDPPELVAYTGIDCDALIPEHLRAQLQRQLFSQQRSRP